MMVFTTRPGCPKPDYAKAELARILIQFCNFLVSFSTHIACSFVSSLNNLKLFKTQAANNIFVSEKFILGLTFNPGLAFNGFQTTGQGLRNRSLRC